MNKKNLLKLVEARKIKARREMLELCLRNYDIAYAVEDLEDLHWLRTRLVIEHVCIDSPYAAYKVWSLGSLVEQRLKWAGEKFKKYFTNKKIFLKK